MKPAPLGSFGRLTLLPDCSPVIPELGGFLQVFTLDAGQLPEAGSACAENVSRFSRRTLAHALQLAGPAEGQVGQVERRRVETGSFISSEGTVSAFRGIMHGHFIQNPFLRHRRKPPCT